MMAFNVADGSLAWSFDLIPTGTETGADTWETPGSARARRRRRVGHVRARSRDRHAVRSGRQSRVPTTNKGMRPGANLFTISTVALDARTGKLKWWYQLRPNDDHDWDNTTVSLFDAGGRKLVATGGKEGILHVVDRDDGKLVFKLPMTTRAQPRRAAHAGGRARVPGGRRPMERRRAQPEDRSALRQRDRLVHACSSSDRSRSGSRPIPYTGLANGWGTNDPIDKMVGLDQRRRSEDRQDGVARAYARRRCTRRSRPPPATCCSPAICYGNFLALDARNGKTLYSFDTGGPIAGGVVTYEQKGKQYVAVASGPQRRIDPAARAARRS